jgi:hypothetical protein
MSRATPRPEPHPLLETMVVCRTSFIKVDA